MWGGEGPSWNNAFGGGPSPYQSEEGLSPGIGHSFCPEVWKALRNDLSLEQVNQIAIKAWKSLPNKGEVNGNLTKILQGPIKPFSDFVACLVEAAGRDFGITAAIVAAISFAVVGSVMAVMAMSTSVQTASKLNELSKNVATALDAQSTIDAQLKGGLIIVKQRIDLVQIDTLWQLAQLGYKMKYPGLCVTSIQYENFTRAANLS